MPRKPSGKPKRNIWKDPSPYGTYTGPRGSSAHWKQAFSQAEDMGSGEAHAILEDDSPWGVLGLSPDVTYAQAKSRFRALMLEHHPDRGGNAATCERVIAAWTLIKESFK